MGFSSEAQLLRAIAGLPSDSGALEISSELSILRIKGCRNEIGDMVAGRLEGRGT